MPSKKSTDKFVIRIPGNQFYFLPPLSDLCKLLKIKLSPYYILKDLEAESGVFLTVGKTSLYGITKDGVSQKVKKHLLDFISKAAPELKMRLRLSFSQFRSIYLAHKYKANAGGWFPVLAGFKISRRPDWLSLVTDFCESRAYIELDFCKEVKKFDKSASAHSQAIFITEFMAVHTLIPNEVLNGYVEVVKRNEETGVLNIRPVIRYLLYGYGDFYQSALAHYEIGVRSYIQNLGLDVDRRNESSIQRALPDFHCKDQRKRLVFNNLLEIMKNIQFGEGDPGWRDLSRAIPINGITSPTEKTADVSKDDETAELREKQYNVLKKWRKGKDLPGNVLLAQFLSHIVEPNSIEHQILYERFKTVIAFDTWLEECKAWLTEYLDESDGLKLLQEVVNHYHVHYAQALQTNAVKK